MANATTTANNTFKAFGAKGFATGAARKLLGFADVAAYVTCNDGKFGFYTDAAGLPVVPAAAQATAATEAFVAAATVAPSVARPSVANAFQIAAARKAAAAQPAPVAPAAQDDDLPADDLPTDTTGPFAGMTAALIKGAEAAAAKAAANPQAATGGSARTCKVEKDRPMQNGIKRPSAGGMCRAVWDFCDAHAAANGGTAPTAKQVKAQAEVVGWNMNNACIEFYQWRKYNGITGRATTVAAPAQAAE